MSKARSEPTLEEVFEELVSSVERPDAETLEDFIRRYPPYAAELTDFAVEWALQDLLPAESAADGGEAGDSVVPAAMRRFRQRLAELDRAADEAAGTGVDPFAGRGAAELARIAAELGLDKTLLAKLRDRKIVADTVPETLRDGLAARLEVPAPAIAAHLAGPALVHVGASFKARQPPSAGPKESFAEAVRRSFLSDEQKARWLAGARPPD